jgi:hypothetical protein
MRLSVIQRFFELSYPSTHSLNIAVELLNLGTGIPGEEQ